MKKVKVIKNKQRKFYMATLALVCVTVFMVACGSPKESDTATQLNSYIESNEQNTPLDVAQEMPQTPQPPNGLQTEIEPLSVYASESIISQYQNRNNEILEAVWAHIAQFESNFSSIYIPIPDGTNVEADNARDVVDKMIEDAVSSYVIGEALGNFGTASSVIGSLFNAGEQASAVMSAYVVEGVIPFTTVLNYIYQKGNVAESDLTLTQDAFGNFMQRVGAVQGTGANAQRYLQAHNEMMDLYSEFHANTYLIGFIESLPRGASRNSANIAAVSDDIAYVLNNVEVEVFMDNAHRRISAFPLNFDDTAKGTCGMVWGMYRKNGLFLFFLINDTARSV